MKYAFSRSVRFLALAFVFVSATLAAGEIDWKPQDINAAMQQAAGEGKLVYIFVEGDNCPPCDVFKESHLQDPAFIDFINTLFVPIRAHQNDPAGEAFLRSLGLVHAAVPRFYVLTPDGRGASMSIGMVVAPPMGGADVLRLAHGHELPVDKAKASAVAARLRQHAASQRASGAIIPDHPLRYLGLAVLEAQAWALAGRLDEAEKAFGIEWAEQLVDQEIREWYINFWLSWQRNLQGAVLAARSFRQTNIDDPAGAYLLGRALAANGDRAGAAEQGDELLRFEPDNQDLRNMVESWRRGGR